MLRKIEYVKATLSELKDFISERTDNQIANSYQGDTSAILESLDQLLTEVQTEIWRSYGLAEAFDMLSLGIVIVRRNGEVSYLNESAKEMLDDYSAIKVKDGASHLSGKLSAVVAESIRYTRMKNYYSDKIIVQIEPLGAQSLKPSPPLAYDRRGGAIVMIRKNSKHSLPSHQQFEDIFGLSAAEAKLTLMLLSGKTLKQSADNLCIAESTARTQIRNILGKTGAKRLQDLISLLLSTPATLRSQS